MGWPTSSPTMTYWRGLLSGYELTHSNFLRGKSLKETNFQGAKLARADCKSDVAQVTTNSGVNDVDPNWQPLPKPTSPKSPIVTVHQPGTGGPPLSGSERPIRIRGC